MIPRVRVVIRIGRGTPVSRAVAYSAVAHVVFVVAALTLPGLWARDAAPLPTLDVTLVGPLAEARPQAPPAPAPTPPQPEPEAKQEPPEGPSVTPKDVPKPVPKPKKKAEKPPEKKAEPRPPAPPPQATPPAAEPDADADAGGPAGPIAVPEGGALAGMGAEFDWYRDAVIRALYTAWRRPFAAGVTETQEVAVAFEIRRDGSVGAIEIVQPSGNPLLDRSALRAVQEAALPPLPRNYSAGSQPARFVFRLEPESY